MHPNLTVSTEFAFEDIQDVDIQARSSQLGCPSLRILIAVAIQISFELQKGLRTISKTVFAR